MKQAHRAALSRLEWRPEMAPADDETLGEMLTLKLVRRGAARGGQAEWSITYTGAIAIRPGMVDLSAAPSSMEQAAASWTER